MIICKSCGAANSDGSKACYRCGKVIDGVVPPPPSTNREGFILKIRMGMKKKMQQQQLILGIILCLGIFFSMFLPIITISAETLTDLYIEMQESPVGKALIKDRQESSLEKALKEFEDTDKKQSMNKKIAEKFGNRKITCTSAQIMFGGREGMKKIMTEFGASDDDAEGMAYGLDKMLFWPRIMLFIIYFFPILLVVIYYRGYHNGQEIRLSIVATWIYCLLILLSNCILYFIIPSKIVEESIQSMGSILSLLIQGTGGSFMNDMLADMVRIIIKALMGIGIKLVNIGSLLLLVYSLFPFFGKRNRSMKHSI